MNERLAQDLILKCIYFFTFQALVQWLKIKDDPGLCSFKSFMGKSVEHLQEMKFRMLKIDCLFAKTFFKLFPALLFGLIIRSPRVFPEIAKCYFDDIGKWD